MSRYIKSDVTIGDVVKTDINVQLGLIEVANGDTLSRKGDTPNAMESDIDLNSNDILNVNSIDVQSMNFKGTTVLPEDLVNTQLPSVTGHVNKYLGTDSTDYTFRRFPITNHKSEVIAHRGFADTGFQNTLLSLSMAKEQGADSLECDVAVSSDGVWYLFHDTTVDSLTDGTGTFTELTSTYIDTLVYDSAIGTPFVGLGISKLDDVLAYIKQARIVLYPEIKSIRTEADVTTLYNIYATADVLDLVTIQSGTSARLDIIRALDTNIRLAFLTSLTNVTTILSIMSAGDFDDIVISQSILLADPALSQAVLANGFGVTCFTIDNAQEAAALREIGVFRLISDVSI